MKYPRPLWTPNMRMTIVLTKTPPLSCQSAPDTSVPDICAVKTTTQNVMWNMSNPMGTHCYSCIVLILWHNQRKKGYQNGAPGVILLQMVPPFQRCPKDGLYQLHCPKGKTSRNFVSIVDCHLSAGKGACWKGMHLPSGHNSCATHVQLELKTWVRLKADRPHPRNYPQTPTDYRQLMYISCF